MSTQDKLRELEDDWLAAERAVLEHPEYPSCMLACARKAVERLEGKCQNREKFDSLFPEFPRQEEASAGSSPRELGE